VEVVVRDTLLDTAMISMGKSIPMIL